MSERALPAYPPDHYFNRELSWLEFNARVLEEAADPSNPLLERLKFLAIFSSNLDEFFEIRVAGLQQQVYAGVEPQDYGADGLAPADQLAAIERRVHELVAAQYRILGTDVLPGLAAGGIERVRFAELTDTERRRVDALFRASVYPVLTPLGGEQDEGWEGCLSVPGMRGLVPRFRRLRYQGFDAHGAPIDREVEGFHARLVQHEIDHLDGILFPQRVPDLRNFGFEEALTGQMTPMPD